MTCHDDPADNHGVRELALPARGEDLLALLARRAHAVHARPVGERLAGSAGPGHATGACGCMPWSPPISAHCTATAATPAAGNAFDSDTAPLPSVDGRSVSASTRRWMRWRAARCELFRTPRRCPVRERP